MKRQNGWQVGFHNTYIHMILVGHLGITRWRHWRWRWNQFGLYRPERRKIPEDLNHQKQDLCISGHVRLIIFGVWDLKVAGLCHGFVHEGSFIACPYDRSLFGRNMCWMPWRNDGRSIGNRWDWCLEVKANKMYVFVLSPYCKAKSYTLILRQSEFLSRRGSPD
jgi:hypothetical protein